MEGTAVLSAATSSISSLYASESSSCAAESTFSGLEETDHLPTQFFTVYVGAATVGRVCRCVGV